MAVEGVQEITLFGIQWYIVTRRYANERQAQLAYQRLMTASRKHEGRLNIGTYRHTLDSDQPSDAVYVSAVGHVPQGIEIARGVMHGAEHEISRTLAEALVARRMQIVAKLLNQDADSGVYEL